jgi:low affinity Fe/Cu permease
MCIVLLAAWVASYALGWSANVRDFLGYGMAAVALLLLALLKNSELRAEHAVQQKLDAIAEALLQQHGGDAERAERELERAIGMHEEV